MKAKELHDKWIQLSYEALCAFFDVKADERKEIPHTEAHKIIYAKQNPIECFKRIDKSLILEIKETYDLLLKKALEEDYFFVGANYQTIYSLVEKEKENFLDKIRGYEEADFLKSLKKALQDISKKVIIHYSELKEYNNIDIGESYPYLFLDNREHIHIKRNIKKATKILKEEVKNNTQYSLGRKDKLKNSSIKHDPSLWNESCFNFFKYLIDNYYSKKKRELTDIWHFLKKDLNEEGFRFYATQKQYSSFIKSYLNLELKNWQQSNFEYEENYKNQLKELFGKYKST